MEEGPSALVVDDDQALRLLCRVNLELEGFVVREAATVAEAEAVLETGLPDVALLDVHLGREGTEVLLERLRDQGVPVLLVTGSADIHEFLGRADEVLAKPFELAVLVAAAQRLVSIEA